MRTTRTLVIEVDSDEVLLGEPVTVRVRDRLQNPIEGVTVSSRRKAVRTDETGRCRIAFHAPGLWSLTATKFSEGELTYRPATTLIRAVTRPAMAQRVRRIAACSE
ncbi:carboxypeptidase regulatory-like domain-containing protein [Natronococcus sp. A-GB1]|uniref:carboxypeptidase regulatory-like domain-containing protein n=1 Tax=Natronococcus sp. A-GB1 TaxID=3037648 RepID=UPI00241C258C|nr:carboxypeptidase regulatory-like domain-containing protein [Natronococcus sp. A-GB1]MDG5760524.1 carboxypeptidase regulatory-like domain-containing protein [Natronococcus sp. A-GB1]